MQVTFKSAQTLGNKSYAAGLQTVPDNLRWNVKFKELVKSGQIVVAPRNDHEQNIQASKDEHNKRKAEIARKLSLSQGK